MENSKIMNLTVWFGSNFEKLNIDLNDATDTTEMKVKSRLDDEIKKKFKVQKYFLLDRENPWVCLPSDLRDWPKDIYLIECNPNFEVNLDICQPLLYDVSFCEMSKDKFLNYFENSTLLETNIDHFLNICEVANQEHKRVLNDLYEKIKYCKKYSTKETVVRRCNEYLITILALLSKYDLFMNEYIIL
jgi:hypothetical protein